jgi:allantoicase
MADVPVYNPPAFVNGTVNLLSARLGAAAVWTTDDFFAPLSRMLQDEAAVWKEGVYDDNGKWMDGWESRRKRTPGHDVAVVKLAMPGRIAGFDVDTSYFTGNYPPHCSIEAAYSEAGDPDPLNDALWTEILAKSPLGPSAHHFFETHDVAANDRVWTHLRMHISSMVRSRSSGRMPIMVCRTRCWGRGAASIWGMAGRQRVVAGRVTTGRSSSSGIAG